MRRLGNRNDARFRHGKINVKKNISAFDYQHVRSDFSVLMMLALTFSYHCDNNGSIFKLVVIKD